MFRHSKNNPYSFIIALVLGVVLAVGGSVWATSVGTNISVTGTLTVSSGTASSSIATALGVGSTTPSVMFSVGGDGTSTGHGYFSGGVGIGLATTTGGVLETTGAGLIGGVLNVTGATQLNSTLTVSGNTSLQQATTTHFAVTAVASTTNLTANGTIKLGALGTNFTNVMHGFCDFGPIVASQSIAATSTGTVACTTQAPTGHVAGDKVWLTASTTATGTDPEGFGQVFYTGIASSTAAGRIQAMIHNDSGVAFTVTTSSWQYFIIR